VGFDYYSYDDFSKLEYYERRGSRKKDRSRKGVKDVNEIVLDYLLSVMDEEEKDRFYRVLDKVKEHRKPDPALLLAVYEYVMVKEGKVVNRDYIKFIKFKVKGMGKYAIRQRKKFLGKILKEDPVLDFINTLEPGMRKEAVKLYEVLKKENLIHGKAEARKKILLEYLNDYDKKKQVLEMEFTEELVRWNFYDIVAI